jgi:hypothetical protein
VMNPNPVLLLNHFTRPVSLDTWSAGPTGVVVVSLLSVALIVVSVVITHQGMSLNLFLEYLVYAHNIYAHAVKRENKYIY